MLVWSRYLAQEWHVRTGKEDRFQFSTCYLNVRRGGVLLMIDRHRATSCTDEEVLRQVPCQKNTWDCGVFLLHYVEKFCLDPKEDRKDVRLQ